MGVLGFETNNIKISNSQKEIEKNIDVIKNKSIVISNPLEIPYFTPVPFKLGDNQEVKYIIKPCVGNISYQIPETPSDNFLRPGILVIKF